MKPATNCNLQTTVTRDPHSTETEKKKMLSVAMLFSSSTIPPGVLCSCSSSRYRFRDTKNIINASVSSSTLISQQRHHLRLFSPIRSITRRRSRSSFGPVCFAAPFSSHNLQWACTVASVILMLVKGTAVQKSLLVPLFALQAPMSIISWIKGEYGAWTAFLALLVRLFYFIPGELEPHLAALLLVIVAPHQLFAQRGTQTGAIVSLALAGYLTFQHFSRLGSLQSAFDQGSVVATLAIICIIIVPGLLLI